MPGIGLTLLYVLKIRSVIVLSIWNHLRFHMNFRMAFSISAKIFWGFRRNDIEFVDHFRLSWYLNFCCCSVVKSCLIVQTYGLKHARLSCHLLSPGVCSNLRPLSQWCYLTISSSVTPCSSCPQSFLGSGSFLMIWLFASVGQTIGGSASASVLPMSIQDWFPLGLTGLISLQSKGLSRVICNTTVQKHQLFGAQPSLWSIFHNCTWLLEKTFTV